MNDGTNADWPAIIAIALIADSDLGKCRKPGQRMRRIYWTSYRKACEVGYHGSERDWETFMRVRARAENRK